MTKKYDVIIIGAGIIGSPIAYELTQMGYKTLNIDKLSDAGEGSTAASCAIVRAHYSTEDGVAMAYEGFKYWQEWEDYLGHVNDEKGLAKYMNTGSILLKSQGHDWRKVKKHYDAVGVKYEEWSNERVNEAVPVYDLHEFWPVRRPEDPKFFDEPTKMLEVPKAVTSMIRPCPPTISCGRPKPRELNFYSTPRWLRSGVRTTRCWG